ncbi:unnamed protein product [Acanthoscelides obtectus]|uniref:BTB domain-containing protein n=1 Tax=Acanthoscelides obtectus TaxID=200917 RepID=A0A9P0LGQ9_ACAOB|nr:unnamed protein product [Acanthoscelides obtectus]CAK1649810.1 Protein bric-a-brac 1 [Acanthoscelides obtectus]
MKSKTKQRPQVKKTVISSALRHRGPGRPTQGFPTYEENFKRAVVQYAEQKSVTEARKRYGISITNIKQWLRLKRDAEQQQISAPPPAGPPKKPEQPKKSEQKISAVLEVKLTRSKKLTKCGSEKGVPSSLDAMPLEKRLRAPTPTASTSTAPSQPEPVLHSQPLSPTKLKVTRQAARPGSAAQQSPRPTPPPPTPPPAAPPPQDVCLRWNTHHTNMQTTFPSLLLKEQYVDATLVADGQTIKCHRVILSSCSPYFEDVLSSISPYQHPVLFMKDVPFWTLRAVCDFMYAGEVNVAQNKLEEFLAVADNLKIKGLARTIDFPPIHEVKKEPDMKPIKEEQNDENRENDMKDIKDSKETVKEMKDKEKKEKEAKEKKEKELKEQEILQTKQRVKKRHNLPVAVAEMPVLKSAKLLRSTPLSRQNVEMPVLKTVLKPPKTKPAIVAKKSEKVEKKTEKLEKKVDKPEKKLDKPEKKLDKPEKTVTFAPQKSPKESPSTSKIYDPMNLLKPVYEEVTKEKKTQISSVKVKESKQKKLKKRKMPEEREESPPPVLSRKGTRSRPNRKMAKFYHTLAESGTIVREPHTNQQPEPHPQEETTSDQQDQPMESQMDQADPLMQMEIIKDEPVDMEENAIDIVENVVSFGMQVHEEEMIENYDMSKSMKIVNVADIKGIKVVDPLTFNQDTANITITNIQSLMEKEDSTANQLGFKISSVVSTADTSTEKSTEQNCKEMGFKIGSIVSEPSADIVPKVEVESTGTLTEESQDSISDAVADKTSEVVSSVSEALQDIKQDIQRQSLRKVRHVRDSLNEEERLLEEDQIDESRLLSDSVNEALLEDDQLEMGRVVPKEECDSTQGDDAPRFEDTDDAAEEHNIPEGETNVTSSHLDISRFIKEEKEDSQELTEHMEAASYAQDSEERGDSQDLANDEIPKPGQPDDGSGNEVKENDKEICSEPTELDFNESHKPADTSVREEFRNSNLELDTATVSTDKDVLIDFAPTEYGESGENLTAIPNKPIEMTDEKDGNLNDTVDTSRKQGVDQLAEEIASKPIDTDNLDPIFESPYLNIEIETQESVTLRAETDLSHSESIPGQDSKSMDTEKDDKLLDDADMQLPQESHREELDLDNLANSKSEIPENESEVLDILQLKNDIENVTSISEQSHEENKPEVADQDKEDTSDYHALETDITDNQTDKETIPGSVANSQTTTGILATDPITLHQNTKSATVLDHETGTIMAEQTEEKLETVDELPKSNQNEDEFSNELLDNQKIAEAGLNGHSGEDIAPLTTEAGGKILDQTLNQQPYQETGPIISSSGEPTDKQTGDLLSMNIERMTVEDAVMAPIPNTPCPMDIPDTPCPMAITSDGINDSTEPPIDVPPGILDNFDDDEEILPTDDIPNTVEAPPVDVPSEIQSTSDIIADQLPIFEDIAVTRKAEDIPSPGPVQELTKSLEVQPSIETSDVLAEASKENVCDTSEDVSVPESVQSSEHNSDPALQEIPTLDTKRSSEDSNYSEDIRSVDEHSIHDSECTKDENLSQNSNSYTGFEVAEKEGCDAEKQPSEECTMSPGEPRRLSPILPESQKTEPTMREQNLPPTQSIDTNTPGFHIAQVVNQQIALNEEHRSCPTEQSTENVPQGSSDLESIVHDLTMIVGEDLNQPAPEISEVREDDTNVIAESLENLLEN